jgi:Xaa-Pro aminopeptidase
MEETSLRRLVEASGCQAVVAFGADNFRYLTGATLPFPENYPERQAAAIIPADGDTCAVVTPPDWAQAVKDQGWMEALAVYDENEGPHPAAFSKMLGKTITDLGLAKAKLGYDATRASAGLVEAVHAAVPKAKLIPVDGHLATARANKTTAEVALIEKSCEFADRGIIHALNHLEGTLWGPGYTVPEYIERVRVHLFESGGSGVGHMAATFGEDTQLVYVPHRGDIVEGLLMRTDVTSHSMGYWSSISRMSYTGYPPPEVEDAYEENQELKTYAESLLIPGTRCDKIYTKVKAESEKMGAKLHDQIVGHGVGCSHFEAPYLVEGYEAELKAGNVVALGVTTLGPHREIYVDRDVYEITREGARKLSWYRNWDKIYAVTGFRAVH